MTEHFTVLQGLCCQWKSCDYEAKCSLNLHVHLAQEHGIHTQATILTRAKSCYECGIWTSSQLAWDVHASHHARYPDIIYGPIFAEDVLAAGRRCPYCMRNGLFPQMDNNLGQYREHIESHMRQEASSEGLQCPQPGGERCSYDVGKLRVHLDRVHGLPLLH
jgi:hypothetical protein